MNSNFGENVLARYKKIDAIGKGTYGVVFKSMDTESKELVAVKKINYPIEEEGIPSTALREISLLREIQHRHVVALKDVVIDNKKVYLVFEFVEKDLQCLLQELGEALLEIKRVKRFLFHILSGLAECHSKRILHRDLKPANILIDKNDNAKLADFGLARTFSVPVRPYSEGVVTLWYRAPEILLGALEYGSAIDIWSVGCIFVEMVTKNTLFKGDTETDQIFKIFRVLGVPSEDNWPGVTSFKEYKHTFPVWTAHPLESVVPSLSLLDPLGLDLLHRMLRYDPATRITARAALAHPWFKDMK